MGLDGKTLKNLIERANPQEAARRFKTGGSCRNEGVFRFCQLLKSAGVKREDAGPHLLAWYNYWKPYLVDNAGAQLYVEDIEIQAGDVWDKIKYGAGA